MLGITQTALVSALLFIAAAVQGHPVQDEHSNLHGLRHCATGKYNVPEQNITNSTQGVPFRNGTHAHEARSYYSRDFRWTIRNIQVCWEPYKPRRVFGKQYDQHSNLKEWSQRAVESSWGAQANKISFHGWKTCKEEEVGIRIAIASDEDPHTTGMGTQLNGRRKGMTLYAPLDIKSNYERWKLVDGIAIHEFGHALGFNHEHNRPDTDRTKCSVFDGPQTDTWIRPGPYDPQSVMNYCADRKGERTRLTELDKAGFLAAYPPLR
jgi:hypothetical protein